MIINSDDDKNININVSNQLDAKEIDFKTFKG